MTDQQMPRVLITGGNGLLGRSLAKTLSADAQVCSIVRKGAIGNFDNHMTVSIKNSRDLNSAIREFSPNVVVHNAAYTNLGDDPEVALAILESNIELSNACFRACAEVGGIHLINCDSYSSYDHKGNEAYIHYYGTSKNVVRNTAFLYAKTHAIKVTNLVLYDIFSELDTRPAKIFNRVITALRSDQEVALSAGHQEISFVHLSDVVDAIKNIVFRTDLIAYVSLGVTGPEVKSLKSYFLEALENDRRTALLRFGDFVDPRPQPERIFVSEKKTGGYEPRVFFGDWLLSQLC